MAHCLKERQLYSFKYKIYFWKLISLCLDSDFFLKQIFRVARSNIVLILQLVLVH